MWRGGDFEKLLDKATLKTNLEPDFDTIIKISDKIRQNECVPKQALVAIKKRLQSENSTTATHALLVLESVVKNCGSMIHDEVATKAFMEFLRDLTQNNNDAIKQKTLEILQAWAYAFRSIPKYKAVQEMVTQLKAEGHQFPPLKESDAMFDAESAPEWTNSPTCHRCRTQFGLVNRKHHCRACGNTFCGQCSGKQTIIPKYGLEKEVRVCETCYEKYKNTTGSPKVETETLPTEYLSSSLAQQKQSPKQKSAEELKEEEELELALAISQSEAEAKEMEKKRQDFSNFQAPKSSPPSKDEEEPESEELARYLNRSHWDQRADRTRAGSPDRRNSPPSAPQTPTHQMENGASEAELSAFAEMLDNQVRIFVNRMKSDSSRGRSISDDSQVQSSFMNMTKHHAKLLNFISQQEESRIYYEGLQDKLAQVKDAVAALEDLRNEHQEKLRQEAEVAERVKQQQMAYKLQIMRKKKQEYLQQQRVIALQRLQEQEREMQMRKQQQQYGGYMMSYPQQPQGYPQQVPPGYGPQGPPPPQVPPGYPPQGPPQPQPYLPSGYHPPIMHQNMGMHGQMQGGQSVPPHLQGIPPQPSQHSLPHQVHHQSQNTMAAHTQNPGLHSGPIPQGMTQVNPGQMLQGMHSPAMIQQSISQEMQNPGHIPQGMQNNGSIPHGMQNPGHIPQGMQNNGSIPQGMPNPGHIPQGMQNNGSIPPGMQNHGSIQGSQSMGHIPHGMQNPGHISEGMQNPGHIYPGMQNSASIPQGMQNSGQPHSLPQIQNPSYSNVGNVPMAGLMQQQQQQQQQPHPYQQQTPEQELIRFD